MGKNGNVSLKIYRRSLWCWKRPDGTYSAASVSDILLTLAMYARQTGQMGSYFSSDISCLTDDFLSRKGIELNNVIGKESRVFPYYDTLRGTVQIESRKKKETIRYDIGFCDLVTKDSKQVDASFESFVILDPCPLGRKVCGRVVPWEVRNRYEDKRTGSNIPSPHIRVLIDNHGAFALHWLVDKKRCHDLDVFGFNTRTIEKIEREKEHVFSGEDVNEKNLYFLKTDFLNPWYRRVGQLA